MENLEFYIKKLEKLEENCCICKAKMCMMCPNNKNKKYLKNEIAKRNYLSLKEIALQLDDSFCRCHRSYIVNLKYVERIEGMNCITKNKQVIPISKKYKNDFIEKIVRQM